MKIIQDNNLSYIHNLSKEQKDCWNVVPMTSKNIINSPRDLMLVHYASSSDMVYIHSWKFGFHEFINDFLMRQDLRILLEDGLTSINPIHLVLFMKQNPQLTGKWGFYENGVMFENKDTAFMFKLLYDKCEIIDDLYSKEFEKILRKTDEEFAGEEIVSGRYIALLFLI